ncbi:type 1 glutamine amidotransferase [Motiliproteus coralliicola]|uniref:Type 1 glutamine amidotransferase n=1 Tax=Motiliproteus coralliicola TaxID=2283196 RepID=A0A369WLT8_9GAMM|nr:type 1 glutamine amidotransferase [Motiliproteus coralliicola]RDE23040.1 type 1 glutamine amidotransferase [Motiliproteus coralliicola]
MQSRSAPQRDELRILLVQIREEAATRQEELDSFARFSGLQPSQFSILNLFDTPSFSPQLVNDFDAVYVGGSSEASVMEPQRYPFIDAAQALLRYCIEIKKPVFASCFGHQLAAQALGVEIVRDEQDFEMGTLPILLHPAAADDPLYRDTSDGFMAVAVHRERALGVPAGCTALAYTDSCNHAFKVDGAPFWTTQFHPEVDRQVLVDRLTLFRSKYTDGDGHLQQVLDSAVETPESNDLLRKFVDRVLLVD